MESRQQAANRECELELAALAQGQQRQSEHLRKNRSRSPVGRDFFKLHFDPLCATIALSQAAVVPSNRARGRPPSYVALLRTFDPPTLTYAVLESVFEIIDVELMNEADTQCSELRFLSLLADKLLLAWKLGKVRELSKRTSPSGQRHWRQVGRMATKVVGQAEVLPRTAFLHLASMLLRIGVESGLVLRAKSFTLKAGKRRSKSVVRLPERVVSWLSTRVLFHQNLATPVYQPMIVSPAPWKQLQGGGYLLGGLGQAVDMIKHRNNRTFARLAARADLSKVRLAVNALQETPWRINRRVFQVQLELYSNQQSIPGVRSFRKLPPQLPKSSASREEHRERNAERMRIYRNNAEARQYFGKRIPKTLELAERLLRERAFYFPHQLDFRGRAYPIPLLLHPQSYDMARALLQFAEGRPIGNRGGYWLAVHLGNLWGHGLNRKPFAERVAWVRSHEKDIVKASAHPLQSKKWWGKADDPWRFLATCMEWTGFLAKGARFRSHIPVTVDGTCNGLQHLSALGRDSQAALSTNILSSPRPLDIYHEVVTYLRQELHRRAKVGDVDARMWLARVIDRRLVKRPTMTTPYGVTVSGIREQLFAEEFARTKSEARYLAPLVRQSIGQVAAASLEIMKWLQGVARRLAGLDRGVAWITPLGFPLVCEERQHREKRISTSLGTLVYRDRTTPLLVDRAAQIRGIAPNFVHALDACHMMRTILELRKRGLNSFAMVHDSFGVHARDVDELMVALRKAFVWLHKRNILVEFREAQQKQNRDLVLDQPPQSGQLDIGEVMNSNYFFC